MLAAAEENLAAKLKQRDELNVAIIQAQDQVQGLRILIMRNALAAQAENQQQTLVGLTEAIRSILRLRNVPMTAGDVKNALDLLGFNFGGISNPSAAVHNTLKRMAETLELTFIPESKAYRIPPWIEAAKAAVGRNPTAMERFKQAHQAKLARETASKTPGQQIADLKAIQEKHK